MWSRRRQYAEVKGKAGQEIIDTQVYGEDGPTRFAGHSKLLTDECSF